MDFLIRGIIIYLQMIEGVGMRKVLTGALAIVFLSAILMAFGGPVAAQALEMTNAKIDALIQEKLPANVEFQNASVHQLDQAICQAVSERPEAAVQIVDRAIRNRPDMVAEIAGSAAECAPDKAVEIAVAAATAVPSRAEDIVRAISQGVPGQTIAVRNAVEDAIMDVREALAQKILDRVDRAAKEGDSPPIRDDAPPSPDR